MIAIPDTPVSWSAVLACNRVKIIHRPEKAMEVRVMVHLTWEETRILQCGKVV